MNKINAEQKYEVFIKRQVLKTFQIGDQSTG